MPRRRGHIISEWTQNILFERFKLNPHKIDCRLDGATMDKLRKLCDVYWLNEKDMLSTCITKLHNEVFEDED